MSDQDPELLSVHHPPESLKLSKIERPAEEERRAW